MLLDKYLDKENNNLDLVRYVLAAMVIFGHGQYLNKGDYSTLGDPIVSFANFSSSGDFAVKVFFFISGLVITSSVLRNPSAFYFIVSRIFRLFPALIFVVFVTAFIIGPLLSELTLSNYFGSNIPFKYFMNNSFLKAQYRLPGLFLTNTTPDVNGSLWTLVIEFRFYLVLLSVHLLINMRKRFIISVMIISLFIDNIMFNGNLIAFLGDRGDVNHLPYAFALGVFFRLNSDKINLNWLKVLALLYLFYFFKNAIFAHVIYIVFICTLCLYLAISPWIMKYKLKRDLSYGVYLWGFVAQQITYQLFGTLSLFMHVFIALIMATVLAYITNILVEKPGINFGRKIYNKYNSRFSF